MATSECKALGISRIKINNTPNPVGFDHATDLVELGTSYANC
ncbi:MAG: hypothetical protein DF168_01464 [Candidatus Moanabacter tarae]|uniref:Uncharacterized protein n=1 Tax=Candidatus Moanibacter tarae TaxID=2200854 RepID=A0A2Z4AME9_9BACT|nr:MAG: hypothetical protein DF168_01464 [Candidatus Moanabacter tarae]